MRIQLLIEQLKLRLPELEWKISQLPRNKDLWRLPQGIFRLKAGNPYSLYIDEIKKDIQQLEQQVGPKSQWYLAKQIEAKIALLIRMSVLQKKASSNHTLHNSVLQRLSTRKQWMEDLEQRMDSLNQQICAMKERLANHSERHAPEPRLQLEQDIGQASQQLTLLQERYQRASSDKSRVSRPYTK